MRSARRVLRSVPPPSDDDTGDSGGYSEQGGGGPDDTYAHDEDAIRRTEMFNPPDLDEHSPNDDFEDDPNAGYDNDDGEEAGGQEASPAAESYAPTAPQDSWAFGDRRRTVIPAFMYAAPRNRPGGEEGDDSMDASDYVAALNGMGDSSDYLKTFGKDVGVSAATAALTSINRALGGAGAKKVELPPTPPMSAAAKIAIGVVVGMPILYFLARSFRSTPAAVKNPRRRRSRR